MIAISNILLRILRNSSVSIYHKFTQSIEENYNNYLCERHIISCARHNESWTQMHTLFIFAKIEKNMYALNVPNWLYIIDANLAFANYKYDFRVKKKWAMLEMFLSVFEVFKNCKKQFNIQFNQIIKTCLSPCWNFNK